MLYLGYKERMYTPVNEEVVDPKDQFGLKTTDLGNLISYQYLSLTGANKCHYISSTIQPSLFKHRS